MNKRHLLKVTLKIVLFKKNEPKGEPLIIIGNIKDKNALVIDIAKAMTETVGKF